MLSSSYWRRVSVRILLIGCTVFACVSVAMSQAQSNAADLQGTVRRSERSRRAKRNGHREELRDQCQS